MKLHEKLYSLRKKNGYTQAELAEMLGVSRQSVSNWELGTIQPSTSRLKKLSEFYSVPLEELLDEGVEVQLHTKPTMGVTNNESKSENTEITVSSPMQVDQKRARKKVIGLVILGIIIFSIIGILVFVFSNNSSDNNPPQLEQFDREKVIISSENGFDLQ